MNALSIIPCKTASCSVMGDYAIKKKMTIKWGKQKRGDIVLFDFNHNGTSDHTGIVVSVNKDGTITTIEGNTSTGNNCNGGAVMRRTRVKSNVNYFVRPKYNSSVTADMIVATAEAEVGVKESPRNSNNVKYNTWFYGHSVKGSAYPWCMTFVCWLFAHVKAPLKPVTKPTGKYNGVIPQPTLKRGSKGDSVKNLQKFLNWYHSAWKLAVDGDFGGATDEAVRAFQKTEGIGIDGIYGKDSFAKAKTYKATAPKPTPKPTTPTRQKMSKIGHARKDYDHKAGDSSGKEVCKTKFTYNPSDGSVYDWTYVFRPKDIAKANKAADMCEKAIANNAIGYNSHGETAYGKAKAMTKLAKAVKYDLSKIKTKCGCSCGDLICLCNHWAGLSTCYIGSGKQLAENLKKNNNFQTIKYKKGMQLYRGDVLITAHSNGKNNHVVMCL